MENTNYDHDSSQTKTRGLNNTLLLAFTPFTVKCLLETLERKRNSIPTTLGIRIALLGHQAGKQKQEGRKPVLEIHKSLIFLLCLPALLRLVCYAAQTVKPSSTSDVLQNISKYVALCQERLKANWSNDALK